MNTIDIIVEQYTNEDKIHSIEKERNETMQLKEFQQWLSEMKIGSRIELREGKDRANELMKQWNNSERITHLPKWLTSLY